MAKHGFVLYYYFLSVLALFLTPSSGAPNEDRQTYVVYMGSLPEGDYFPAAHHVTMLQEVVGASVEENIYLRSYKRSFNGFAARLTESERQKLAAMKEVVSVFPNTIYQLHTTRSWGFIGFNEKSEKYRNLARESDLIVGVIDTGVWPESKSFSDEGFGPAPAKWKGDCQGGYNFTCNKKVIGARFYMSDTSTVDSARDTEGHGSHTASTAAGNKVEDVSFHGIAQGTAMGGVPSARIAAYKVCDSNGCSSEALLAAFDDAIADGVDVISISIGGSAAAEFSRDPIAIGSFHAMAKGILTVNSAGNSGPTSGTVGSVSPWMLSVAASTLDRAFITKVVLGNGKTLVGKSINGFSLRGKKYPLAYGEGVSHSCDAVSAKTCSEGCVDSDLVRGKIVLCDSPSGAPIVHSAGGVGVVVQTQMTENVTSVSAFPASALVPDNYEIIQEYLESAEEPVAEILKSETTEDTNAPVVAYFSSRGPNRIVPDILKPDITAPGVDILAAYSPFVAPTNDDLDTRRENYNVISGTSMSCPHLTGAAAYVKTRHPDWSPAAIKSALMTTAWPMSSSKNADAEFAYGSGHVNPVGAVHPGLVYDAGKEDYIKMLCGSGYDSSKVQQISGDNSTCPEDADKSLVRDLNYPSMAVKLDKPQNPFRIVFQRTVTNVGGANSTYKATVSSNPSVQITVKPIILSFKSSHEKKSFTVTVAAKGLESPISASLVWSDSLHKVRSPIVVYSE